MAVYFKFKSAKDYDSVAIDGHFISLAKLKDKIVEKKNMGRATDFDLLILDAQTEEEYTDEGHMVPRNTSVLVRRVPWRRQKPIVAEVKEQVSKEKLNALESKERTRLTKSGVNVPLPADFKQLDGRDWGDKLCVDLYAMPEPRPVKPSAPQQLPVLENAEEDHKIKAFVQASASDWLRELSRGTQGRSGGRQGFGRVFERQNPPPGYVCHRCGIPGHFIQHCPTNGDPAYDTKKMRRPTGIPKSMLVRSPDGSYALPSGGVAILRPNEAVFEKEIEGLPIKKSSADMPPELCCPLCNEVLKDAVLTSRCCFKSYCDKCIRNQILSMGHCMCGATNVLADDLVPNKTLRDAISRLLETTTSSSSEERAGSMAQLQEMESKCVKQVASCPAALGLHKDHGNHPSTEQLVGNTPLPLQPQQPTTNIPDKAIQCVDQSESMSKHEAGFHGKHSSSPGTLLENGEQDSLAAKKQNLKRRQRSRPVNGGNQSEVIPDHEASDGFLPYHNAYGAYWGSHQCPADCFAQSYPQFPYSGFGVPGLVDIHYGGGFLLPVMPPVASILNHQREWMDGRFDSGSNLMSREEFEARKAELRKKMMEQNKLPSKGNVGNPGRGNPSPSKLKSCTRSPGNSSAELMSDADGDTESGGADTLFPSLSFSRKRQLEEGEEVESVKLKVAHTGAADCWLEKAFPIEKPSKHSVFSRITFPGKPRMNVVEKHETLAKMELEGF